MQQRISAITLGVSDVARSRAFYETLGWVAAQAMDDVVFFQLNGFVFAVWEAAALQADAGLAEPGRPGGTALAHNVQRPEDIQPLIDRAAAAGGRILKDAHPTFWGGHSSYFADPDGHVWEVACNPFWPIDAQGNTHFAA